MPLLPSAFDCPCASCPCASCPCASARLLCLCVPRVPPDLPSLCPQAAGSMLLDSAFFSMLPACSLSVNPAVKRPPPLELERGTTVGRGDQHRCGVFQFEVQVLQAKPGLEMLTWPVSLFATTRSSRPLPGRIDHLDVGDAQAHGNRHGRRELRGHELGIDWTDDLGTEEDRKRAVAGVATTSSVNPSPFRSAVMICAGTKPVFHWLTSTKPPSRRRRAKSVIVSIDTGEDRALIRIWNPGDVARRISGIDRDGGLEGAGPLGDAWRYKMSPSP